MLDAEKVDELVEKAAELKRKRPSIPMARCVWIAINHTGGIPKPEEREAFDKAMAGLRARADVARSTAA